MKLLLTSSGIKNRSLNEALVGLLGKPIAEANALCIPTAIYSSGGFDRSWDFVSGRASSPMCELGWKTLGLLELTALPSIDRSVWVPKVHDTDVLLVYGGDAQYLGYWMRQSGLADLFSSLKNELVYVGWSAGSMVMTPTIGEEFARWTPPAGADTTLGLVDFSIFPHLDHVDMPGNSMADAEEWAANLPGPAYGIDDETAIRVVDGEVDIVTEGHWRYFGR